MLPPLRALLPEGAALRTSAVVLACLLGLGAHALAQTAPADGPSVPVADAPSAPGAFDIVILPIRSEPSLDFWSKTLPSSEPGFATISRFHPDDEFLPVVLLKHIGDRGDGTGHVTLEVSVRGADGETEVLGTDIPAWDGPLPRSGISLGTSIFGLKFDGEEALGTVTLSVTARDAASASTVRREVELEFVPWSYGEEPASAEDLGAWMTAYHTAPAPAEAVRAWLEFARLHDAESGQWHFPVLEFFRHVFLANPWLVPHLVGRFPHADAEQRFKIAALLHLTEHDDLVDALSFADAEERRQVREQVAALQLPDPYGPLVHPAQLDLLWGEFLATARYAPVRQLVRALELAPFEAAALAAATTPPATDEERSAAFRGILFGAARWSLDSNLRQHALVRAYADYMLAEESLGETERAVLASLLAPAEPDTPRDGR
jgi:hypothetical protein